MRPYTTNYSDRQVDVEMLQTITAPAGTTPLQLTLGPVGRMVSGMQKLVQRYTVLLLTQLGDIHFDEVAGTTFLEDMLAGASQNPGQIEFVFAFASVDAIAQMREEDDQTTVYGAIPDDERIERAELLEWAVDYTTGVLYLKVDLYNESGDSYTYVLPATVARR